MKKNILMLAMLLAATSAYAQEPIVIKINNAIKENTPKGQAINKFKELAEKYTNGKVKVEVGHDSYFASQRDEIQFLRENKIQMDHPAMSKIEELYQSPEMNPYAALDIPYLFKDLAAFAKFADSPVANEMAKTLEGSGVKFLGYWDNGFKMLSTNKAVNKPEDLKGLAFRVQPSSVIYRQFKVWGAQPRELNLGDMYTATLYETVDGAENPASNFTSTKLYETQKYLYTTNHGYLAYVWLVNDKFWNRLPGDVRNELNRAIKETTIYERALAKRDNEFALQRATESGLVRVVPPSPELDRFLRMKAPLTESAMSPVQKEWYLKIKEQLK